MNDGRIIIQFKNSLIFNFVRYVWYVQKRNCCTCLFNHPNLFSVLSQRCDVGLCVWRSCRSVESTLHTSDLTPHGNYVSFIYISMLVVSENKCLHWHVFCHCGFHHFHSYKYHKIFLNFTLKVNLRKSWSNYYLWDGKKILTPFITI